MLRIVDLSHPLENGQLNFTLDPKISVSAFHSVAQIGYNLTQLSLSTHQGTHVDAPYHFFDDGSTIDLLKLGLFYGEAAFIDFAPNGALPVQTPLTAPMFMAHEALFQPGARIIYRTGWDRMFGKAEYFTQFPTLTLEAARWIASRKIAMLGMDTPTPSADWLECHKILLAKGTEIVLVEGLRGLEQLSSRFTFIGFPLNIKGRDGSPIRAVGILE
jgi:kynurenine formamidase